MRPYLKTHYLFNNLTGFIFATMKYFCSILCLFIVWMIPLRADAQKQLPDFSVKTLSGNKIQVSWNNPYPNCIQLAVQRSVDSVRNFRTIFSSQSPELISNGFVDAKPLPGNRSYYRIFYVLQGGAWFYTNSQSVLVSPSAFRQDIQSQSNGGKTIPISANAGNKEISLFIRNMLAYRFTRQEYQAFRDSINHQTNDGLRRLNQNSILLRTEKPRPGRERVQVYLQDLSIRSFSVNEYHRFRDSIQKGSMDTLYTIDPWHIQLRPYRLKLNEIVSVYRNDSLLVKLESRKYREFRDSINAKTKDTLVLVTVDRAEIHVYIPVYVWRPSPYIFTNANGYVTILLPNVKQHRYQVIFFEEDGKEIFRIKSVHEPELILDKTDFMHAGWFNFELYEDDKLKEKNKFQLTRN